MSAGPQPSLTRRFLSWLKPRWDDGGVVVGQWLTPEEWRDCLSERRPFDVYLQIAIRRKANSDALRCLVWFVLATVLPLLVWAIA